VKLLSPAKTNTSKEIVLLLFTCHWKLVKSEVNIETQFRNVTDGPYVASLALLLWCLV